MLPPLPQFDCVVNCVGSVWVSMHVRQGVDPRPHLLRLGVPLVDGPALSVSSGTLYTFARDGLINYRWMK